MPEELARSVRHLASDATAFYRDRHARSRGRFDHPLLIMPGPVVGGIAGPRDVAKRAAADQVIAPSRVLVRANRCFTPICQNAAYQLMVK
jgi:hypothetical protein